MPILKVLTEGRVPVKIWSKDVELEAQQQLINTAALPFVFKHVAAMADVHGGKGATVGSVVATKGAICPATVGVDIGCGMAAIKTPLNAQMVQDKIKDIRHSIERSIPVGFNSHKASRSPGDNWTGWGTFQHLHASQKILNDKQKFTNQLGTLGGGNHFIEICLDTENNVWVMLHSGSRNIGKTLAEIHIDKAKGLMKKMFISLPDPDLAYLVQDTVEFDQYIKDLTWAQEYAMENRRIMLELVMKDLAYMFNNKEPIPRLLEVNCHHNYVARENHFNENVLVTRKGAVRAREGDLGIIPSAMGQTSYIVKGKGNVDSFCSCSHGAGRKMSRTKAKATFTTEDLIKQTEGVECRKDDGVVDEIPGAYKNIQEVMDNQSDLVEIVASLKSIMCIKG
jgi:tRNA-splicing ligase RtcB